ncbi:uncharacterized protein LOC133178545 [Saccostrea echinata]|uniref:uncharacterized protein LOC133178545 n=1 Tax=Saccostrea echinata TaxID=191078 RepID=UPI002A819EAF|nr:uncharacterized protein LOC133178545 [Saccostrea echinata]
MNSEVYQRTPYQANVDNLTPVDLGGAEETDEEEEEEGGEEEGEEEEDLEEPLSSVELSRRIRKLVDPGPFRHNRKVAMAALPCFLIILAICGEPLLLLVSVGVILTLVIDTGSKNQRTVMIFTFVFIPCHMTILYFTFPLVWVSVVNIALMVMMNSFILLTGGWALLQMIIFRKQEPEICVFLEAVLFSGYPALSACLTTWAIATFVPLIYVPFILLFIGFVLFQVFMTPATSSFKLNLKDHKEDVNILNNQLIAAMATGFCLLPVFLQILIALYQRGFHGVFHLGFFCELLFLLCLAVFLMTLMSIRHIVEAVGFQYSLVIQLRSLCGGVAAFLSYPVFLELGVTSHFLSWLPFAVGVYAVYGTLLSYRKLKFISTVFFVVAVILSLVWAIKLPWKLSYTFMFGISLKMIFCLMIANSVLCLTAVHLSSHGTQAAFSLLVVLQTIVFIKCEVILFDSGLYNWPLFMVTGIAASYTLQRLQIARRLPVSLTCACMSAHVTKSALVAMVIFTKEARDLPYTSILTMFFFIFMMIKMLLMEVPVDIPKKQLAINVTLMCISVLLNANPVLFILGSYLFKIQASAADAMGMCFIICGMLIIATCVLHLPSEVKVKQLGILGVVTGVIVIMFQPDVSLTANGIFQLCEVISIMSMIVIMYADTIKTFPHIVMASVLVGITPGLRAALYLYPEDQAPVFNLILFGLVSMCLVCALFAFSKSEHLGHKFEKNVLSVCMLVVLLSVLSLVVDLVTKERKQPILTLPSWKLFLAANLIICICTKVVVSRNSEYIPLHEKDDKEIPYLPLVGNITTITSFLFLCLLGPSTGLLYDIWCCGASVILMCLQRDMKIFHNLKDSNHTTPTKIISIVVLILSSICRSDIWHSNSWTFVRSFLEILLILGSTPIYYVLWGILWKSVVLLPEPVVVFLLPLNAAMLLYGSSWTCWVLAFVGISSSVWMMSNHFKLIPYSEKR